MIGPGGTAMVPAVAIHRVLHAGVGPAVTIHAYSPPLRRTGAYRVGPDGQLERASVSYRGGAVRRAGARLSAAAA